MSLGLLRGQAVRVAAIPTAVADAPLAFALSTPRGGVPCLESSGCGDPRLVGLLVFEHGVKDVSLRPTRVWVEATPIRYRGWPAKTEEKRLRALPTGVPTPLMPALAPVWACG